MSLEETIHSWIQRETALIAVNYQRMSSFFTCKNNNKKEYNNHKFLCCFAYKKKSFYLQC